MEFAVCAKLLFLFPPHRTAYPPLCTDWWSSGCETLHSSFQWWWQGLCGSCCQGENVTLFYQAEQLLTLPLHLQCYVKSDVLASVQVRATADFHCFNKWSGVTYNPYGILQPLLQWVCLMRCCVIFCICILQFSKICVDLQMCTHIFNPSEIRN